MADPQQIIQTQTSIPDYAKPYMETLLGKMATTTAQPFQPYTGARMADFTDLQEKAMGSYASPEAYTQGLGAFMSPYMQNVVDVQKRQATQTAGAQTGALNAKAAQMGAFGGSGVALQRAQQGRDLQQTLNDIQTKGSQAAYDTALQQMPQFLNQQYNIGTQQQQWQQKTLEQQYQDYLDQQNYPYKQLSFQSDILRGIPLSQGTQSVYQAPPSAVSQITGLGTAALGGLGMYNAMSNLGAKAASGGSTEDISKRAPAGLADLAVYNMG